MSAIGKLTAAVASGTVDTTIALANLNFDFSLYKVEAPKEFHGVGTVLSSTRRTEAESGRAHITARKLGALFEPILPPAPQLVKAYGLRASEILSSTTSDRGLSSYGVFANQIGADGTSIWAAATSSHSAIKLHLLACMLARIWEGPEAISIWVEIVDGRKLEINKQFEERNIGDLAAHMAAQQELTRTQLAEWDASARAWLRAADAIKIKQQKQLELIIGNVKTDVNSKPSVYQSVMQALKVALEGMENLVSGMPQKMQTGEILLGLSAWHLFPDMIFIDSSSITISQLDPLIHRGGILTIGLQPSNLAHTPGISWSLPLAHLRYYGKPILTSQSVFEDGSRSRLSFKELLQAILGCIFGGWGKDGSDPEAAAKFIIQISENMIQIILENGQPQALATYRQSWLFFLSAAAMDFLDSETLERQTYIRLINLGKKRLGFLGKPEKPLFGLSDYRVCFRLQKDTEQKIKFLRDLANKADLRSEDVFIRYCRFGPSEIGYCWKLCEYTTALPYARSAMKRTSFQEEKPTSAHVRWIYRGMPVNGAGDYESPASDEGLFGNFHDDVFPIALHNASHSTARWSEGGHSGSFNEDQKLLIGKEFPNRVLEFSKIGEETSIIEHEELIEDITADEVNMTISWHRSSPFQEDSHSTYKGNEINSDIFSRDNVAFSDDKAVAEERPIAPLYKYLWGELSTAALFIRCKEVSLTETYLTIDVTESSGHQTDKPLRNPKSCESNELDSFLISSYVELPKMQQYLTTGRFENVRLIEEFRWAIRSLDNTYLRSLRAIASVAKTYKLTSDATIHVQVLQNKIHEARWIPKDNTRNKDNIFQPSMEARLNKSSRGINTKSIELDPRPLTHYSRTLGSVLRLFSSYQLNREQSFACIIMFESGSFDLRPDQLHNVMAMSAGDSIFVASGLLCDPTEKSDNQEIQRVLGNIGRPGIALLVPPAAPDIRSSDIGEWNLINHDKFDGNFQDCFQDTSLHLSYTGANLPLSVGNSGRQDAEVYILESLVSLHERGKWVADLDILKALESARLSRVRLLNGQDNHTGCRHEYENSHQLTSIRSWTEFLERPERESIVCMHSNWQARLAATTLSIAQSHRAIILPKEVCWGCVDALTKESGDDPFTIIA